MDRIQSGQLLSEKQRRAIAAALALRGLDQKTFADQAKLSYGRLLRMMRSEEAVPQRYAEALSDLVRLHLVTPVRSRAFAA